MYWKNPRTVRRRTVRNRRVFDSDGMDIKKTPRTDARHASIVRQGLEWALTYGQRSAAAFLLVRKVPRPVVERIPISMDGRGRALVVVRQSGRRWEDAYLSCASRTRAANRAGSHDHSKNVWPELAPRSWLVVSPLPRHRGPRWGP